MHVQRWILTAIIALSSVFGAVQPAYVNPAQAQESAERILSEMSPVERVGQLFLVSYQGSDILQNEDLLDLIENYHIGGILLSRENDNFIDAPDTLSYLAAQISGLQDLAYQKTLMAVIDEETSQPTNTVYVPLFVGMAEQTGGVMYSQLYDGMTDIPSAMAIGATWEPQLAQDAGEILGRELQALGVNLYLGPSLDVVEDPSEASSLNLGTSSFGGDPYWVGQMGEAFISGIHSGSAGRVGVISGHFPGLGSSDRNIEEEVATIRKSLEQLQQIDLPPFFQVTSGSPGEAETVTDGLLTSHIRYQGFQGNIRATTRPISLDQQTYTQLLSLEPLATWRETGGLLVSDSLGSNAIRRFLDPTGQNFQAHIVARDAFLAGNDVLILDNFQAPGDSNQAETVRQTLDFFAQKYAEDQVFAQRVDAAVVRILQLKLRIYGNVFSTVRVSPQEIVTEMEGWGDVAIRIAQQAATLINPSREELAERFSEPPQYGERIVFFTDVQLQNQCSHCEAVGDLDINSLEDAVLRFYGQEGARLVGAWNMQSYTFADLANYLGDSPPPGSMIPVSPADDVGNAIENADWLIFSTLDSSAEYYGADALKLFLDRRPDLVRSMQTIAFAFDVPFALDATDISKLDVYFGLYDSTASFVESAARLLFFELSAPGFSPVDIDGIGYHLIEITSPSAMQIISLEASLPGGDENADNLAEFTIGDVVHLNAGPIIDSNGNIVPDGSVVHFHVTEQTGGSASVQFEATTVDGFASVDYPLDRIGFHMISVSSDPAMISEMVQLNVQEDIPAVATVISPTLIPTTTPPPTETVGVNSPTQEVDGSIFTPASDQPENQLQPGALAILILCLALVVAGAGLLSVKTGILAGEGYRGVLVACMAALIGYNYLSLQLPGSLTMLDTLNGFTVPVLTLSAGAVGFGVYYLLRKRRKSD